MPVWIGKRPSAAQSRLVFKAFTGRLKAEPLEFLHFRERRYECFRGSQGLDSRNVETRDPGLRPTKVNLFGVFFFIPPTKSSS
jgi:hypothetical protein